MFSTHNEEPDHKYYYCVVQNVFNGFARNEYEKELSEFVKMREQELRPIESTIKSTFDNLALNVAHLARDGDSIAKFLNTQ